MHSISILRLLYFAWLRWGGDHSDGKYEIPLVVWFTAIYTYLPYFLFTIILAQMYYFTPITFTVSMGSLRWPILKHRYTHLTDTASEVTWACDVTIIERKGDFASLGICYCVW